MDETYDSAFLKQISEFWIKFQCLAQLVDVRGKTFSSYSKATAEEFKEVCRCSFRRLGADPEAVSCFTLYYSTKMQS